MLYSVNVVKIDFALEIIRHIILCVDFEKMLF